MNRFYLYILLGLQFLFFHEGYGQRSYPYYTKKINKYNSNFNQNIVSDLILDNNNILWIATPTSLFQYNGFEIKQIESPNKNRAVNFFQNVDGQFILLYSDGNCYELKKDKIQFYFKDTTRNDFLLNYQFLSLSKNYLNDLFYGKNFEIFYYNSKVTTLDKNKFLYTSNKKNTRRINLYNLTTKEETEIFKSNEKNIAEYIAMKNAWFAIDIRGNLIEIYNPQKLTLEKSPIDLKNRKTYKFINKNSEVPILTSGKRIWILIQRGKSLIWEEVINDLPEFTSIQSGKYSEKLEKLFLATESDGLIILSKNKFTTIYNNQKIHKSNYYLQIMCPTGEIFTNGGSVDDENIHNSFFREHILNNNYIYLDKNTILISDNQYLIKYNFKIRTTKNLFYCKTNSYANFIKIKNDIYVVGNKFILKYNDKTDELKPIIYDNFGSINIDIVKLINNKIWIGSSTGITVYDLEKNKIVKKLLLDQTIRYIQKIGNQYFINSYGEGIYTVDTNTYKTILLPMDYEKSLKYAHCIIQDKNSTIWIPSNTGLLKFTEKCFLGSLTKKKYLPEPEYFNTEDGLLTDEFNGGASPPYLSIGDTFVSLPSIKGIAQFNPLKMHNFQNTYQFKINQISYLDKPIPLRNNLYYLTNNIEEITIDLDIVFWGNIKNLNIYYRLNNIENRIDYKDIHQLKIPIDFYQEGTIELFTFNQNGERIILNQIEMHRELPWYIQWKNLGLSLLVIYLISYSISKIRTNRINKRNFELERLVDEKTKEINKINYQLLQQVNQLTELNNANTTYISVINHDIFAPIKYINIIGDKISQNAKRIKKDDVLMQFNHIISTTKRLELLCSNILNYINSNKNIETTKSEFSVYEMTEELKQYLMIGLEINNNELINSIPSKMTLHANKDALNIIFTNLLSNANRFTKNGKIKITASVKKQHIEILVTDNGRGINEDTLEKIRNKNITVQHRNNLDYQSYGIGYSLIYKMLEILDATFEINSIVHKGTRVKIILPK